MKYLNIAFYLKPIHLSLVVTLLAGCVQLPGLKLKTNSQPVKPTLTEFSSKNPIPTPTKHLNSHPETPSPVPTTIEPHPTSKATSTPDLSAIQISIIYDNNAYRPEFKSDWGFSALIEMNEHSILFDTGGDGNILLNNMDLLNIDPSTIEKIIISHAHHDHAGGLEQLSSYIGDVPIYVLPSFAKDFKNRLQSQHTIITASSYQQLQQKVFITGKLGTGIPEQALVIDSSQGLVVITGCAHPGIINILQDVHNHFQKPIYLVIGGFHLGNKSQNEIDSIIQGFRDIGVAKIAPCHCTGKKAIWSFEREFGSNFIKVGAGKVLEIPQ